MVNAESFNIEMLLPMSISEGPPLPRVLGIYWPWYKKKEIPTVPPEEGAAGIKIQVYDSQGNLVPSNSPLTLDEGSKGNKVVLTVKNNTTKGGVPWIAALGIGIGAATEGFTIIPSTVTLVGFEAGQTRPTASEIASPGPPFTTFFDIPMGAGGQLGSIMAWVEDPSRKVIKDASELLAIRTIAIVYGATIVIGP